MRNNMIDNTEKMNLSNRHDNSTEVRALRGIWNPESLVLNLIRTTTNISSATKTYLLLVAAFLEIQAHGFNSMPAAIQSLLR